LNSSLIDLPARLVERRIALVVIAEPSECDMISELACATSMSVNPVRTRTAIAQSESRIELGPMFGRIPNSEGTHGWRSSIERMPVARMVHAVRQPVSSTGGR
jgi:hypothetical protein